MSVLRFWFMAVELFKGGNDGCVLWNGSFLGKKEKGMGVEKEKKWNVIEYNLVIAVRLFISDIE